MERLQVGTKVIYRSISGGNVKAIVSEYMREMGGGPNMLLKVTSRKNPLYQYGDIVTVYANTAYVSQR